MATVAVLNVVGVVMVLSASSVASLTDYGSPWYFFLRQLMWTVFGLIAFVFAVRFDYRRWRGLVRPLLVVSVVLLVVVLVPGIGIYVSGSRRWLGAGFLRFQPSEIAKLALLLYAADLVSRRAGELHDWRRVLRPVALVLAGFALLVMKEPDLGSAMVLALVVLAVLVAGGVRKSHLAIVGAAGITAVTFLAMVEPYRRARMLTFLHPFADSSNTGYQISQSLIALGSGGLTGVGLGAGRAKWNFLPNAHTDFIFAIIGEELGLIGCFLVMALFVAFGVLGIARRAARARPLRYADRRGRRRCGSSGRRSSTSARSSGLLPVTGIPLPFVSFGGSALITTMLATGILVNVARQGRATPARRDAARSRATVTAADVLISGGGTGGHVFPALALAEELVARGYARERVRFVGAQRGLEATAVPGRRLRHRPPARSRPPTGVPPPPRRAEPPHRVGHRRRRRPGGAAGAAAAPARGGRASAATRRSRRWSAPASRACRRSCTRPTPIPAWPTGSRCASAPAPRSPSPGRRSPGRWSPAIPSGPPSPPCAGRR